MAVLDSRAVPTTPAEINRAYRYWRVRILATSIFGYALFYFVRTNIGVPLKAMGAQLGYSKEQLGIVLTLGGLTYGISKFANGLLGDHANPRWFMALGLFVCAVMNIFFGLSSTIVLFSVFWALNNWAQGMGFPPCAKSMAYWFSPGERSSTFGIWHTSHMIGAALISALTGYLVQFWGWRSCFYIPAGLAVFGAAIIYVFLRDTPASMGLPTVEEWKGEAPPTTSPSSRGEALGDSREAEKAESYWQLVRTKVLTNPYMWVISIANLLVYVLRSTQSAWGPTFLQEAKGISVVSSGWLGFGSEMGGMFGALVAGFVADRVFGGRAGRVCVIAMALMAVTIWLFLNVPRGSVHLAGALFITMGFLLYVPQMLIAAMAMTLGTKRAAAAAVGLTAIVGYLSTIVSGWGVGHIADRYGWQGAFGVMLACTVATMLLMLVTWNVGAHAKPATPLVSAGDAMPAAPLPPAASSPQVPAPR